MASPFKLITDVPIHAYQSMTTSESCNLLHKLFSDWLISCIKHCATHWRLTDKPCAAVQRLGRRSSTRGRTARVPLWGANVDVHQSLSRDHIGNLQGNC